MAKIFLTLTILCVFGAVLVKGFDKKQAIAELMATIDVCKGEVGAKDSDVEEVISKKPATSMEGKCLRSCMMKKYDMMDSNGKLVKTVAVAHAVKFAEAAEDKIKIINEIADACDTINVPDDHCEAAAHYCKCFKEQAAAHGMDKFEF